MHCLFSGGEVDGCKCSFSDCQDYLMAGHNYERYGRYHVVPVGMVDGFNNIICDMHGGWIVISYQENYFFYNSYNIYKHTNTK